MYQMLVFYNINEQKETLTVNIYKNCLRTSPFQYPSSSFQYPSSLSGVLHSVFTFHFQQS